MKTLGDIIELCKEGEIPDVYDARMAICVLDSLLTFESISLMRLARYESEGKSPGLFTAERNHEEHFNRVKKAFQKTPIEWLGPNNDPDQPEVQKRRKISNKLVDRILDKSS